VNPEKSWGCRVQWTQRGIILIIGRIGATLYFEAMPALMHRWLSATGEVA
jgi:hypothetical protein